MEMHPLVVHLKVAASVDDEAEAAVVAIETMLPLQSKAKALAMQRKMETTLKTHHRKMEIQTSPALKALKVAANRGTSMNWPLPERSRAFNASAIATADI